MTNTVDQAASPEPTEDVMRRLMNAHTKEELDEVIRTSGI
jgi:hypothetical protein